MLDLSSFENALSSLARVLDRSKSAPDDDDIRDACIQRFEYTYELAVKMLRRRLAADLPSREEFDQLGFRDFVRVAAQHGYISDPLAWFSYRDKRNITSHTYDEEKAREVYGVLDGFVVDAGDLLEKLKLRNA